MLCSIYPPMGANQKSAYKKISQLTAGMKNVNVMVKFLGLLVGRNDSMPKGQKENRYYPVADETGLSYLERSSGVWHLIRELCEVRGDTLVLLESAGVVLDLKGVFVSEGDFFVEALERNRVKLRKCPYLTIPPEGSIEPSDQKIAVTTKNDLKEEMIYIFEHVKSESKCLVKFTHEFMLWEFFSGEYTPNIPESGHHAMGGPKHHNLHEVALFCRELERGGFKLASSRSLSRKRRRRMT